MWCPFCERTLKLVDSLIPDHEVLMGFTTIQFSFADIVKSIERSITGIYVLRLSIQIGIDFAIERQA